ncbi:MAG: MBL fold metallo-hydrolase [Pseudomonadales bacterium]|nr:MBL fold metallo-hydrolase [Pseudomonadales bacterium]
MLDSTAMIFRCAPVGPLACNCSIIGDPVTKRAIVVDPGGNPEWILDELEKHGLKLVEIIHTHAHLDHILASGYLKEKTGATISLHKEDMFLWDTVEQQCMAFGLPYTPLPAPDKWLADEQPLACCEGTTMHTPGHTPGSVSFLFDKSKLLIAGDTLFRHSIGRTDFPGGDYATIEKSIQQRIYTLDEDVTVITGHGEPTTVGDEKRSNPFVRAK